MALLGLGSVAASLLLPGRNAMAALPADMPRWLELVNLHTGEAASVAFRITGELVTPAVASLQHVLRDHRSGEGHAIDPALFDQMADLAASAGVEPRFQIISGYRSPKTNAALNAKSDGVAVKSLHMEGRAIDLRLRGVKTLRVSELALSQQRGGVGYYAGSDFVHIDTGRVRTWKG